MKLFNTFVTYAMVATISFSIFSCTQFLGKGTQSIVEFMEIEKGFYSNYPHKGEVQKVINNASDLSDEWEKVFSSRHPVPESPYLNFNDRQVILLMLDTKPSGGYGITDLEVVEEESQLMVRYSEIKPGNGCMLTQAITKPYLFISIPNIKKKIHFMKKEPVVRDCS